MIDSFKIKLVAFKVNNGKKQLYLKTQCSLLNFANK